MTEELRLHVDLLTEQNVRAGLDPVSARQAALREFGGLEQIKERCRDERSWLWLEAGFRDLRLAVRSLRRAPLFSAAVITTLALCLGPNTAILTMLYALVLKPQPFPAPDRIVQIYNASEKLGGGRSRQGSSVPQYRDFAANADLFESFAIMRYAGTTLEDENGTQRVTGMRVKAGFFDFFGVRPLLGRFGLPDEDVVGRDRVLVLTRTMWESRFNADPRVIGRVVRLGGEPWTIIGVAPRSVEVLDPYTMFFKPYESVAGEESAPRRYDGKSVLFGRLKPGVSRATVEVQLNAIEGRFVAEHAPAQTRASLQSTGHRVAIEPLGAQAASAVRTPLALLQAGAALVLLIGAVNVLNLMLARANTKRPEFAVRHALGAGRAALLRQSLAESLLLTMTASAVGVALAWGSLRLINRYLPLLSSSAASVPVHLEPAMIAGTGAIALVLAALVGGVPFVLTWRAGLKLGESRTASAGAGARTFGGALVVGQVALALALLVIAGLLVRSFERVLATDAGFDTSHLLQARVAVPNNSPEANIGLQRRIVAGLGEIPGVEQAAIALDYTLSPSFRPQPFVLRGESATAGDSRPLVAVDPVSPEFFATLRITLLEGQTFTYADDARTGAVVVDDLFARRYFPGRSAVGRELVLGTQPPPAGARWGRIVGVVRRPQLTGLEGRDGLPIVFVPMVQQPAAGFSFVVRSSRPVGDLLTDIRAKLRSIEPALPLYGVATIEDGLESMLTNRRALTGLLAAFAGLALLLAGIGLYGVLAYDVTQRTREIGIRSAVGASHAQIVRMILGQGMGRTGLGLVAGLAGAAYLTRFIRGLLFDVPRFDPLAFGGVSLLMLAVALLACWLPARRAARVDPVIALRAE